jgi:hypothetical protein
MKRSAPVAGITFCGLALSLPFLSAVVLCSGVSVDRNCSGKFVEANSRQAWIFGTEWNRLGFASGCK